VIKANFALEQILLKLHQIVCP